VRAGRSRPHRSRVRYGDFGDSERWNCGAHADRYTWGTQILSDVLAGMSISAAGSNLRVESG
jgi:hypothetical protein